VPIGNQSLNALINDNNPIFVTDDSPNAEQRYRARFYFDPNSITMANNDAHFIFMGYAGNSKSILQIQFRQSSGAYQVKTKSLNDNGAWVSTKWFPITDVIHSIEVDWRAASAVGSNNGGLALWIDGNLQADLTGIDNDTHRIDRAKLGALSGLDNGTRGTYYFDNFESRRQSYIGP
jgi:hypothetical protein